MGDRDQGSPKQQAGFLFILNGEPLAETAGPSERRGRKRPHLKSRRGCLACKRRRVKCDEQLPCSNCQKREERCVHSKSDGSRRHGTRACVTRPASPPVADGTQVNLLHLELLYHFQRDIVDTLAFPEIWQQVIPWSFQEPYIMSAILCLAATHLSILRPGAPQYSHAASNFLAQSASLFRDKLSDPITAKNSEAVIATSVLMQYISWNRIEFLEEQEELAGHKERSSLIMTLLQDPLFQLSSGVRGVFSEVFPVLQSRGSVFVSAWLYSPRPAIEEFILQQGEDPQRFVDHFMSIWDDPRYQVEQQELQARQAQSIASAHLGVVAKCTQLKPEKACAAFKTIVSGARAESPPQEEGLHSLTDAEAGPTSSRHTVDLQRAAVLRIAERLSLLFCLVSISESPRSPPSPQITGIQPDIERCFLTFPVLCGAAFRDLTLQGDPRILVLLCHFYRAARILLTSPASWWARRRSHVIESLILRDLSSRGLETCIL